MQQWLKSGNSSNFCSLTSLLLQQSNNSALPLCKDAQALDASTWGVVSERSAVILHNFIVSAALRQAAASSSLCSITDL